MMQPRAGVYVITGIMAAGKSTIGQLLAKRFAKGVHVRGDAFRRMIVSGRVEMTPDPAPEALEQLRLRYRIAAQVTDAYYRAGFSVVVQDNYLGPGARAFLAQIASRPLYYITLNPSADAIRKRERERNKTGYASWDVEGLHRVLVRENPRIGLWIDTSDLTPEETVSEIVRHAESEARIA